MTDSETKNDTHTVASNIWQHARDTVLMLNLAIAQIEISMADGEKSIATLTESFIKNAEHVRHVQQSLTSGKLAAKDDNGFVDTLIVEVDELGKGINKATIAFQFYDKLTQRLSHISSSLTQMARLLTDKKRVDNLEEWGEIKEQLKKIYSMVDEKKLFDAILSGVEIHEAIKMVNSNSSKEDSNDGEIELF